MNGTRHCSVPTCDRPHWARDFCGTHYLRFWKSPQFTKSPAQTVEDRFWAKVDRSAGANACWAWTAALLPEGYGAFWDGSRTVRAHRYSLALISPFDESLQVDHTCHNGSGCTDVPCAHRACVNPAHLEAVTQQENISRGQGGIRSRQKTHCRNGHEYTPENTTYPIRPNGKRNERTCKTCRRESSRRHNAKRKATS